MRFFLFYIFLSFFFVSTNAQVLAPVKWTFTSKSIEENQAELIFTAKIDKGWHLYSQKLPDGGPIPTSFKITPDKSFKLIGKVSEGKAEEKYDPNFDMKLLFFSDKAVFKQKIQILSEKDFEVKGTLEFMVCDDSKCLPPEEIEYVIKVKGVVPKASESNPVDTAATTDSAGFVPVDSNTAIPEKPKQDLLKPATTEEDVQDYSFWTIFIKGFVGGLLALFTPCVFPMIPLTVSFFTKNAKSRGKSITQAVIYGVSIVLIYVLLGMLVTLTLGPDALNAMSSNVIVNLLFFAVFIIFALSFLGAFEITLPSSWVNKADAASEKGGLIGIFFMAFTLSLVSFSCTGPIIGTLLVDAAVGGNILAPTVGMIGFSLALALPFTWFATFPGFLSSLPKSGSWLNSVKVVLGLLELALALKFLSNVDLAYHLNIITREVFIAIWIIIFSLLGFYLLGKIKFSHDSDLHHVTIPRLLFSIIVFSFVVYLIPGMWGAPLRLISGFPPPEFYNEGWRIGGTSTASASTTVDVIGIKREHCPHNLPCFHDYDEALAYAKQVNKPLMVDFTGWSCVNCRRMEDKVWKDERVMHRLANDFVLVSLYVDDKIDLPKEKQYVSKTTGKKIKTTGNRWSDFQTSRFGTNSQPFYVLLDHSEHPLNKPTGYNPDIEEYIQFLDEGKKNFHASK